MTTKFVLGLEPTKAISFLKGRVHLLDELNQKGLMTSARANALRIANISSFEMTKDIYDSLSRAKKDGLSFYAWRKQMMAEFERKGWVTSVKEQSAKGKHKQPLLADPHTGEVFGTPRRLELIYRVNMQTAMSASRYQRYMENIDNRPYWQYSSILDDRTRPTHRALHGEVYRYDDPFWATFYPPNGFNCRCTVKALSARDLARGNLTVNKGKERLINVDRDKSDSTIGYQLPNGNVMVADKGFDYNIGRTVYKPNLDNYPAKLSHQFAKAEMKGGEFETVFNQIDEQFKTLQKELGVKKLTGKEMKGIRDKLSRDFKFAAGILNNEIKTFVNSNVVTVWLSDDSLIKQMNSRLNDKYFSINTYGLLPEIINKPDNVQPSSKLPNHFEFVKVINGIRYFVVIKVLKEELFLTSFRIANH